MRLALSLALVLLLAGCDRPFIEPAAPTLELIGPEDLSVVRSQPQLPLALRASSPFGTISRVEINGVPATFHGESDAYLDTLRLDVGLNRIVVEAFTGVGTVGTDTLYAVYLPYQFSAIQGHLPASLGGHAATTLRDGTVLITGGAGGLDAPAQDVARRFDPATFAFTEEPARLRAARVGHTASRLPDGRVLIVGGSTHATPTGPADLVPVAELFDPADGTFVEITVETEDGTPAPPVQRTSHTATVIEGEGGRVGVYLYGGLTERFDGEAVAPSEFMRTLRFETNPDRLVAVGPRDRFRFVSIAGHTQTPLADVGPGGFGRYLVAGTSLADGGSLRTPFLLSITPDRVAPVAVEAAQPRTDHAAAPLGGLVLVTGGRVPETTGALRDGEIFAGEATRFFRFNDDLRPAIARWGHTATNLGGDRILLVGGFSASGEALQSSELFLPR